MTVGARIAATCAVLLAAGGAAAGRAATPRLRNLVVVGDSLLAGFGSGGLVTRGRPGQRDSAAAFVARRARVRLAEPYMTSPGVPPPLHIVDRNGNGQLDTGEVVRRSEGLGFRDDPDRRAHNLAVPGETVTTVFEEISPQHLAESLLDGDGIPGRDVLKLLILGLPLQAEGVSQVTRARELHPTFLLVWIGSNDVLDMAVRTSPGAADLSPAEFGDWFRRLLDALADTGAGMAVANVPDLTAIAVLRRAAEAVRSCRGPSGELQAGRAASRPSGSSPTRASRTTSRRSTTGSRSTWTSFATTCAASCGISSCATWRRTRARWLGRRRRRPPYGRRASGNAAPGPSPGRADSRLVATGSQCRIRRMPMPSGRRGCVPSGGRSAGSGSSCASPSSRSGVSLA